MAFHSDVEPSKGNVNLVDELEEAFQNCIHALTKDEPGFDDEGCLASKQEVDQTASKFIDLARQIEVFFLQKRFLVLNMNPELLLKEENSDLRHEIARKDELLRKHFDKIDSWKQLLQLQDQPAQRPPQIPPQQMPPQMMAQGNPMMMQQQQPPPMMMGPGPAGQGVGGPGIGGPNPQMFMQQSPLRPNFNQGPLDYLLKTTNNIDSVGLGDNRR